MSDCENYGLIGVSLLKDDEGSGMKDELKRNILDNAYLKYERCSALRFFNIKEL